MWDGMQAVLRYHSLFLRPACSSIHEFHARQAYQNMGSYRAHIADQLASLEISFLISVVSLVCNQNNAQLNVRSVVALAAPPNAHYQLTLLS